MAKKSVEQKFREQLQKKHNRIIVSNFLGMTRNTQMICQCGFAFESSPKKVLKSGCPECAEVEQHLKKWRQLSVKQLNAVAKDRIKTKIKARAKSKPLVKAACQCGYAWTVDVHALIVNLAPCPRCTAPSVRLKNTTSILDASMKSVSYTYLGKTLSFTPHAVRGKNWYYFATQPDLKMLHAVDKACVRSGRKLELGLIRDNKVHLVPQWQACTEDQVEAVMRRKNLKECLILSMDPGVTNYAWSVIKVKRPFNVTVLASGMIKNTVSELPGAVLNQVHAFRSEVQSIIDEFDPQFMIAERYMSRGMGGTTIECVNIMIGILSAMWTKSADRFKIIPAAQWKNEWNKHSSLEEYYTKVECVVHQVDSIGIGLYGASHWLDEQPFATIAQLEPKMVRQINATNRGGLK